MLELGGLQCSEVSEGPCRMFHLWIQSPQSWGRAVGRTAGTSVVPGEMFATSGGTTGPFLTLFAIWAKGGEGAGVPRCYSHHNYLPINRFLILPFLSCCSRWGLGWRLILQLLAGVEPCRGVFLSEANLTRLWAKWTLVFNEGSTAVNMELVVPVWGFHYSG